MDSVHFHLVVNHFPIIVLIVGLIFKSEAVKRTAYLIFSISALTSIAAMNSGEGAEDVVEKIAGVSESYIETHEEEAEIFSILSYLLGGLSLIGFWASFKNKGISNILCIATLIFALVVLFFGVRTGVSGGEIRHTEIRGTNNIPSPDNYETNQDDDD